MAAHFFLSTVSCAFLFTLFASPQHRNSVKGSGLFAVLTDIAHEELSSDPTLEKPRVSVIDHKLFLDVSPVLPPESFGPNDRYGLPLEAMIRGLTLRRDFTKFFPRDTFWTKPVQSMEDAAREAVDQGGIVGDETRSAFENTIATQAEELAVYTRSAAERKNLNLQKSRDPVRGFIVQIVIQPSTARVQYMRFLTYQECQKVPTTTKARTDCMREEWNDLSEGRLTLIGRYHYLAAWGTDLGGDEEGTFSVDRDSTVTFHPPRNVTRNGK